MSAESKSAEDKRRSPSALSVYQFLGFESVDYVRSLAMAAS